LKEYSLKVIVNGKEHEVLVKPYETLSYVLRERLGLTGTKRGCDYGGCGACTVIINGESVYSCMYPAMRAAGKSVVTIEGLSRGSTLHPVERAYLESGAMQCGYCTPGLIMSTVALLIKKRDPSDSDIIESLTGNICRCTGYAKIVEAVRKAAAGMVSPSWL